MRGNCNLPITFLKKKHLSLGASATIVPGHFSVDFLTFIRILHNIFTEWNTEDKQFLEQLFLYGFDASGGLIQFASLAKGLSCLCKGTLEEKLNCKIQDRDFFFDVFQFVSRCLQWMNRVQSKSKD